MTKNHIVELINTAIDNLASNTNHDTARITILTTVEDLQRKIHEYEQQESESIPVCSGSEMEYAKFAREVKRRLVHADRNWQIVFEKQTGLSKARFPRFFRIGMVDRRDYIGALSKLSPVVPGERAHRDVWTVEQINRVRVLTQAGKTEVSIAKIMSRMTGRDISENVIKRLKLNSRLRKGVFQDDAFGGPIGNSR